MSTEGRTVTNYVRDLEAEVERLREAAQKVLDEGQFGQAWEELRAALHPDEKGD